ncbi:MAG: nitroreductase family deazaflavin-dependent oxidoreductase [Chloroflexota bacterium]|nr:nitroreductase family deazaflavin-dependent oxidoreductase [Chloroflexota bacterium]
MAPGAAEEHYCYLRTTGRVSGRPHDVEMWFAADGHCIYLLAGGRDRADWVRNIQHDPAVWVRIDDVIYAGHAWSVEGTATEGRARELLSAKYYGWQSGPLPNAWAREALPIAIDIEAVPAEITPSISSAR